MVTYLLSEQYIVAVADSGEIEFLQQIINSCLVSNGLEPWAKVSVEAFEMNSRYLIFARSIPPVSKRLDGIFPRLMRRQ